MMMVKYVVFIKNDESKVISNAIPKMSVTHSVAQEMKRQGFRKHFVEVEADNEKEAINKLNEHNNGYLNSLGEFSGSMVIISSIVIIMALIYWFV
nr:hypothetical protein [Yersinia mollaretii]